jgi:hypothetical protein
LADKGVFNIFVDVKIAPIRIHNQPDAKMYVKASNREEMSILGIRNVLEKVLREYGPKWGISYILEDQKVHPVMQPHVSEG